VQIGGVWIFATCGRSGHVPKILAPRCSSYPRSSKLISISALEHFDPDQLSRVILHSRRHHRTLGFHSIAFDLLIGYLPCDRARLWRWSRIAIAFHCIPVTKAVFWPIFISTPSGPLFHGFRCRTRSRNT